MDRIKELKELESALVALIADTNRTLTRLSNNAKSIAGRAEAEGNREFTAAEQNRVDAMYREHQAAGNKLADAERELGELRAELADAEAGQSRGRVGPAIEIAGASRHLHAPKTARYADVFSGCQADPYSGKFSCLGDLAIAIALGRADPRLIANSSMTGGSGATGGFLVPPAFLAGILDAALEEEAIRPGATVLPMSANELDVPGFDYQDGTSGKRAGLQILWGAESGTLSEQQAKARKIAFRAEKATILCRVSSELAEDASAFDRQLGTAMSQAVAAGLDGAFVAGTGAGQPLGILNAPALITVAKESGQATSTLFLQNLAKMLARLTPASYRRSTWLVHPTVLPSLLQLTVVVQNVAGTENVGGGLAAAVVQGADGELRIFGRPVRVTDACAAFSSAGDVILADLTQYAIGMRSDARIEVAREAYFTTDEIGFKLRLRLDGQPLASAATKLRDGTNTVSPFVALGAR